MTLTVLYKYLLLFLAALVEGPVVAFAAGFMTHLGYFSFWPAYIALILRDVVSDTGYYYIGRFGNQKSLIEKYGKYFKISEAHMNSLSNVWDKHAKKTMFFGKLAYGLSIPIIVSAGLAKMPLKKFWAYATSVTLIQYTILMIAGYYLGASYGYVTGYFKYFGLFIAASIVLVGLSLYGFNKMFAKVAEKEVFE